MYLDQPEAKVHEGFLTAYRFLWPQLNATLATLRAHHPNSPIYSIGHSLGGAFATLAALDMARTYGNTRLFTFGSPRVGNAGFVQYFQNYSEFFTLFFFPPAILLLLLYVLSYLLILTAYSL